MFTRLTRSRQLDELKQFHKLPSALNEVRVNKKAEEILNGFDRIVEKTEAMPVIRRRGDA